MFKKIYLFELNSWFNKPAFYIYAALSLGLTALFMAATAGAFDGGTSTVSSLKFVNSPNGLTMIVLGIAIYLFLLFPNVMGESIHKDFKYNVHKVMYSFPFDKRAYFWGKFLSALTICTILCLCICIGAFAGMMVPGVNQELIGPHNIMHYVQVFLIYIVPGLILFGAIIFATVTFSRSVVAGFVVMIVIYVGQGVADTAMNNQDWSKMAAMLDPFGMSANMYYTKYWTISEQNYNNIPFHGLIIWNRLLWIAIGLAILAWSYFSFDFKVAPKGFNLFKRNREKLLSASHRVQSVQKISIPEVNRSYDFLQNLRSAWNLALIDLKYIVKGGPFIVVCILGLLLILLMFLFSGMMMETEILPTTKEMVTKAGNIFHLFILLLTMIYAGMTINRRTKDNIYQLEDVTANRDWSFVLSKFLSITMMQGILLFIPIIAGIAYQLYQGYHNIELDLYFSSMYTVKWLQIMPYTLLGLLIFTLIPNFYIGIVTILAIGIGMSFADRIGIEQSLFKFNYGRGVSYSDIDGWGYYVKSFYFYRAYWILGGLFLTILGWFTWRRGSTIPFLQRMKNVRKKFNLKSGSITLATLAAFVSMGCCIYYHNNTINTFISSKEEEKHIADYEINYKRYETMAQPRLMDVSLDIELYPEEYDFMVDGRYILKNKTSEVIDTVLIGHVNIKPQLSFDRELDLILYDSSTNMEIYSLQEPLLPGDTLILNFTIENEENNLFHRNAPVRENGTFFNNHEFPYIGYWGVSELTDKKVRKKYGLEDKERMAPATDMVARQNTYISNYADWISFEAKVSTSGDQIAMVPGNLVREWKEDGRNHFHYKMKRPMLNFYNVCSARYEVLKDKWNDVELSIYYHKGHDYNLDRMMDGLKDGLDYFTENFSPYQHDQMRILEVPRVGFAQSFANTVPFSENVGFIAKNDDSDEGGVDFTYAITAHELAHQWWAHQVISGNVQGATMLSESLSEYSSLKVLEKKYGKKKMRKFLKDALDKYLLQRSMEQKKELPLAYNENQQYIHYNKGSMAFYALSDYLGEKKLNNILKAFIDSTGFQEPPYTTSLELLGMIKEATPDSLMYFVEDMFEHITLYDNSVQEANYTKNDDGTYTVDITAQVTKYRTNERGRQSFYDSDSLTLELQIEGQRKPIKSYPLEDYIEVGIFGSIEEDDKSTETELYLQKHKITDISNTYTITVDAEPKEVGIDPYNMLIDRNSEDNRRKVEEKK